MGVWGVITSKNFLILTLFVLATAISIWLLSMPTPPAIHTIMSETHKQIATNLKNINAMAAASMRTSDDLYETYLELLGFTAHPRLYPDGPDNPDIEIPLVVTAVTRENYENAIKLVESVRKYMNNRQVLIFDMGLGTMELVKLQKHCNTSNWCIVKPFEFDKFPAHVHEMHMRAYKPIAIQQALNEYSAIVWTDGEDYLIREDVELIVKKAESVGISAWAIQSGDSTSALTHPKMFSHFKIPAASYYFQHMVGSSHLIIYNTHRIHKQLMLPWVKCALDRDCICPRGAQGTRCNEDIRPKFKYLGCHHYDESALNIILGSMFGTEADIYTTQEEIFGKVEKDVNVTTKVPTAA